MRKCRDQRDESEKKRENLKRNIDYRLKHSHFKKVNDTTSILRASTHQGNPEIFDKNAGLQCMGMSVTAILASVDDPISTWTKKTIDDVLIQGDKLYSSIKSIVPSISYLLVNDLNHLHHKIAIKDTVYEVDFDEDPMIFGLANADVAGFGVTLEDGLKNLFVEHTAGVLISDGYAYGLIKSEMKFCLFNSHSTNEFGRPGAEGTACVLKCDDLLSLSTLAGAIIQKKNVMFTIDRLTVTKIDSEPPSKQKRYGM